MSRTPPAYVGTRPRVRGLVVGDGHVRVLGSGSCGGTAARAIRARAYRGWPGTRDWGAAPGRHRCADGLSLNDHPRVSRGIAVPRDLPCARSFMPPTLRWFPPSYHRVPSAKTLKWEQSATARKVVTEVRRSTDLGPMPGRRQALDGNPGRRPQTRSGDVMPCRSTHSTTPHPDRPAGLPPPGRRGDRGRGTRRRRVGVAGSGTARGPRPHHLPLPSGPTRACVSSHGSSTRSRPTWTRLSGAAPGCVGWTGPPSPAVARPAAPQRAEPGTALPARPGNCALLAGPCGQPFTMRPRWEEAPFRRAVPPLWFPLFRRKISGRATGRRVTAGSARRAGPTTVTARTAGRTWSRWG